MNREHFSGYLWIIVTVLIMVCLLAFASPFGAYVKNNLEKFTGEIVEGGKDPIPEDTPEFSLQINYDTDDSGVELAPFNTTLKRYEQYNVVSPDVKGYVPHPKIVEGTITEDTEIDVAYQRGEYTITYITNNGNWNSSVLNGEGRIKPEYTTYTYGDEKNLLTSVSRSNFTFGGWYEDEKCQGPQVTKISKTDFGDKVFYAKWVSRDDYTITYIMNDSTGGYYYVKNEWDAGSRGAWDSVVTDESGNLLSEYTRYKYGETKALPVTVSKIGYTFLGWSEEKDFTKIKEINGVKQYRTKITETDSGNLTFYAHWQRNTYKINYHTTFIRPTGDKVEYTIMNTTYTVKDSLGNTKTYSGYPTQYQYGDTITLPQKFELEGYNKNTGTKIGWYNKETAKISITPGGEVAGTVNGYPSGSIQKTTVSPTIPNFTEGITDSHKYEHSDLDLYVKPIPNTYTVIFDSNNAHMKNTKKASTLPWINGKPSSSELEEVSYKQYFLYDEQKPLTKNKFIMVGYHFTGWNTDPKGNGTSYKDEATIMNIKTGGSIRLYAQWAPNEYIVKIDLNKKGTETTTPTYTPSSKTQTVIHAKFDTAFQVNSPGRVGYNLSGWKFSTTSAYSDAKGEYVNGGLRTITTSDISRDMDRNGSTTFKNLTSKHGITVTVTAQWQAKTGNITFNLNDSTKGNGTTKAISDNSISDYTFDTCLAVKNPTRVGYIFTGWKISGSIGSATAYYSDSSLKVENGKVCSTVKNKVPKIIDTSKEIYTGNIIMFGDANSDGKITEDDVELIRKYESGQSVNINLVTADVTHDGVIDAFDRLALRKYLTYQSVSLISPIEYFMNLGTGGDITFTAQWTPIKGAIAYDLNDSQGTTSAQLGANQPTSYTFDKDISVSNPTRNGYTFAGWEVSGLQNWTVPTPAGNSSTNLVHYYNKDAYTLSGATISPSNIKFGGSGTKTLPVYATHFINLSAGKEITFTAQWTPNTGTITYNLNGGTSSNKPESYTFDKDISVSNPTRAGYKFTGWTISGLTSWNTPVSGGGTTNKIHYRGNSAYSVSGKVVNPTSSSPFTGSGTISGITNTHFLNLSTGDNLTFTANWEPYKVTIYYNANGGTVSGNYKLSGNDIIYIPDNSKAKTVIATGQTKTIASDTTFGLKKTNYLFNVWTYTDANNNSISVSGGKANCTPESFNGGKTLTKDITVTLKANWKSDDPCVANGHSYSKVILAATCILPKQEKYICKTCGKEKPNSTKNIGNALGHYGAGEQNGTCDDDHTYTDFPKGLVKSSYGYQDKCGSSAHPSAGTINGISYRSNFTYYRDIYCGRETTRDDDVNVKSSNGKYYCGNPYRYKWCVQHKGYENKTVFDCPGTNQYGATRKATKLV